MMRQKTNVISQLFCGLGLCRKPQSLGLIADIRKSMHAFSLKASAMNDTYSAEKSLIAGFDADAGQMMPSPDITAAKLEQDILMKITETSTACDTVISVGDDAEFKKQLYALEQLVKQRMGIA